ncbi:MAG: leishmanolysin, partial [Polyangiaceae bacterium]|nr:leishmanolysin [Polyangiaceae bacterium]
ASGGPASGGPASGGSASGGSASGGSASGGPSGGSSGGGTNGEASTAGTGGVLSSEYNVEIVYLNPLLPEIEAAFQAAQVRWEEVIIGDVPDRDFGLSPVDSGFCNQGRVPALTTLVDDIVIYAQVDPIDGVGGVLGQASPCLVRGSGTTVAGLMVFDEEDLAQIAADGILEDLILHEMGHVIGIGTLWNSFGLLGNPSIGSFPGTVDTFFSGPLALAAFESLGGSNYPGMKVPVENFYGGTGTRDSHWREDTFDSELMTGISEQTSPMPLSVLTIQSLADIGYVVDVNVADDYSLPGGALSVEDSSSPPDISMPADILDVDPLVLDSAGNILNP